MLIYIVLSYVVLSYIISFIILKIMAKTLSFTEEDILISSFFWLLSPLSIVLFIIAFISSLPEIIGNFRLPSCIRKVILRIFG
jgi:hypothetical protein